MNLMFNKYYSRIFSFIIICLIFPTISFSGFCQVKSKLPESIEWKQFDEGLFFTELNGPRISKFSDSKITVLKIIPEYYDFELVLSTESDSNLRTIKEWCELKNLTGALNAGMYSLKDHISGSGYTKNFGHINNSKLNENFNAIAVFNPKDISLPSFQIIDITNQDWKKILDNYNSCFQSIRMIDNNTQPVYWKHKPVLKCSMAVLAIDKSGNVLFIFTRSPYSANEMINFMLKSELDIKTAMYIEGGPEASIYSKSKDTEILKFGSYVSNACANDNNTELRKMPNIIGIRKKTKK